jgi:hypothetical protein
MDHAQSGHHHGGHSRHGHGEDASAASRPVQRTARAAHAPAGSLNWISFTATVHCLTGCAIGEVLGMVIGTAAGLDNVTTTVLAVALAFVFGYLLTMLPLLRAGMSRAATVRLALAADTASITLMEIIDNAIMWAIPGAMDAGLDTPLFWGSLAVALLVAGLAAWPVNRWLIARGRGHAVVHARHAH